jgi:hypothetical protein
MGLANDLIERAEREGGGRWDDPNSNALAVLFGALAREMGVSRFQERDDMAVGLLIQDDIVHGDAKRAAVRALLALLDLGIGPDDIAALKGRGG